MPYLIGVDEAGYGPNLGPLLVAATCWECPREILEDEGELDRRLGDVVSAASVGADAERIAIADSKQLYKPSGSLAELERGVMAALAAMERAPSDWRDLWRQTAPDSLDAINTSPWYVDFNATVGEQAGEEAVESATGILKNRFPELGVRLTQLKATAVFPAEFNAMIEKHGNKAAALSHVSLDLVQALLPNPLDSDVLVHCDKHGGRKRYGPMLQERFPSHLVLVRKEEPLESAYRWEDQGNRVNVRFVAKGDRFLPAALASMFAKYLREQAMRAFNAFWQGEVEGLRPTAGYPLDAKRFKADIADAQKRLGVLDADLWRSR